MTEADCDEVMEGRYSVKRTSWDGGFVGPRHGGYYITYVIDGFTEIYANIAGDGLSEIPVVKDKALWLATPHGGDINMTEYSISSTSTEELGDIDASIKRGIDSLRKGRNEQEQASTSDRGQESGRD